MLRLNEQNSTSAYSSLPDPWLYLRGLVLRGRRGKRGAEDGRRGRGREKGKGRVGGREGKREGRGGASPQIFQISVSHSLPSVIC